MRPLLVLLQRAQKGWKVRPISIIFHGFTKPFADKQHCCSAGEDEASLRPRTTATLAAASVGASLLVAVFAAKALGLVLAGTAGFVAVSEYQAMS